MEMHIHVRGNNMNYRLFTINRMMLIFEKSMVICCLLLTLLIILSVKGMAVVECVEISNLSGEMKEVAGSDFCSFDGNYSIKLLQITTKMDENLENTGLSTVVYDMLNSKVVRDIHLHDELRGYKSLIPVRLSEGFLYIAETKIIFYSKGTETIIIDVNDYPGLKGKRIIDADSNAEMSKFIVNCVDNPKNNRELFHAVADGKLPGLSFYIDKKNNTIQQIDKDIVFPTIYNDSNIFYLVKNIDNTYSYVLKNIAKEGVLTGKLFINKFREIQLFRVFKMGNNIAIYSHIADKMLDAYGTITYFIIQGDKVLQRCYKWDLGTYIFGCDMTKDGSIIYIFNDLINKSYGIGKLSNGGTVKTIIYKSKEKFTANDRIFSTKDSMIFTQGNKVYKLVEK